jgi:hypothetical protein
MPMWIIMSECVLRRVRVEGHLGLQEYKTVYRQCLYNVTLLKWNSNNAFCIFSTLPHKRHDYLKTVIEHNICIFIFSAIFI